MEEVGRIRESVFRGSGAGRGAPIDVDSLDFGPDAYQQLIAFDEDSSQVVAMVRFQRGTQLARLGAKAFRTSTLFEYSERMATEVIPRGVELGRSVVNGEARRARLGLFSLWRGLAALAVGNQPFEFFFGNVTIYRDFPTLPRDLLVATVEHQYAPPEPLFFAKPGLRLNPTVAPVLGREEFRSAREGVAHIQMALAPHGVRMPSILQSYLSLSRHVRCGPTAHDEDFGNAYEMALVVPLSLMEERERRLFGLA